MTDKFNNKEVEEIGNRLLKTWTEIGVINRGMVGGSVRRMVAQVKDLELIVEPAFGLVQGLKQGQLSMLDNNGLEDEPVNLFEYDYDHVIGETALSPGDKNGLKYKTFFHPWKGIILKVDTFLVHDPRAWGMQVLIRTGPGLGFNKPFMTWLRQIRFHCSNGMLHNHPKYTHGNKNRGQCENLNCPLIIPTPTEESVFEVLGLEYIPPAARNEETLARVIKMRKK